jgi:hypothetical protein
VRAVIDLALEHLANNPAYVLYVGKLAAAEQRALGLLRGAAAVSGHVS